MPPNPMQIEFPAAGVVRRAGLRASTGGRGPFPTPWAYNVRLEDTITNRLRGGSFTGSAAGARPASIVYRDRTLTFSGRAITASRVGDSTDTTLSSDVSDTLRPALFQLSEAGEQGGTVVALVPHKDRYLVGFTATETWVLQGDPTNGSIRRISDEVGIVGADAWCVAHDTVYFLTARGLYKVNADGSGLEPLSEDAIPEDLLAEANTTKLDYDHATRSVSIHLDSAPSWFYDTARKGFWPFDTDTAQTHLLLGPFRLGSQENTYGRILNLQGNLATGSSNVTWNIVPGDTPEDAAANGKTAITTAVALGDTSSYVHSSGTWSAGRSHITYPRTRAIWVCLWLQGTTWAYEAIAMTRVPSGTWR